MKNWQIFMNNYFFGVGVFGAGSLINFAALAEFSPGSPCEISPVLTFVFSTFTTFVFPLVLVLLRWKIKDRTAQKELDKIENKKPNEFF